MYGVHCGLWGAGSSSLCGLSVRGEFEDRGRFRDSLRLAALAGRVSAWDARLAYNLDLDNSKAKHDHGFYAVAIEIFTNEPYIQGCTARHPGRRARLLATRAGCPRPRSPIQEQEGKRSQFARGDAPTIRRRQRRGRGSRQR